MKDYSVLCVEFRIYDDEKFSHLKELVFDAMKSGIDGKAHELGYEAVCISRHADLTEPQLEDDYEERY